MAEDQDDSDKTEDPSSRKLEEARQKGQVPQSKELTHWSMIMGASIVIFMILPLMSSGFYDTLIGFWAHPDDYQMDENGLSEILYGTVGKIILLMIVPFAVFCIAAILPHIVQHGILFAPDHIQPKLERISLLAGFKRIFSMKSVVELLKGIAKIIIVGSVVTVILFPAFFEAPNYIAFDMGSLLNVSRGLSAKVLIGVVSVITVIAALDWLYQRMSFMKQMRMSRHEVKEEYRQTEGDPMVKQRLKQIRHERARKRMMANVPKSTVVVTNPTHYAIALKYEENGMEAPKVVAKGVDAIALRIREVAAQNDVPIMENPPLARALYSTVDIDEEIPTEYYKAVAEVISYVFKLKKQYKPSKN